MPKLNLDEPLNRDERYFYAMAIRLDALCNMLSSFIQFYADKNGVAVTSNEDVVETVPEAGIPVSEDVIDKPKKSRKK